MGIPHAPGYPTYVILAKVASVLIPFGNISFRINVFSALTSAFLVSVAFQLFRRSFSGLAGRIASLASAATLGLTPLFIDQARAAEVFGLNLLIIAGVLWALGNAQDKRAASGQAVVAEISPIAGSDSKSWIFLAFFLLGLGIGNHQTVLFVGPLLAWQVWLSRRQGAGFFLQIIFFCALGISVYIFLPLRARVSPLVNFGDPETWARFWAVVSRKEFGTLALHPAAVPFRDGRLIEWQLLRFLERCWENLGGAGLILMGAGLALGFFKKETRFLVIAGFLGFLLFGTIFEVYSNLSPGSSIGQWRLLRFFMIPLSSAFLLVGTGLFCLFRRGVIARGLGIVLLVFLLRGEGNSLQRSNNLRGNFSFRDFSISALRAVPPQSRLVIDRILFDEPTSSLLVRTQVEEKRRDVQILYRPGTLFEPVYGKDILDLPWAERYRREEEVEKRILSGSAFPLRCLAFNKDNVPFPGPQMEGLLYRPASAKYPPVGTFALCRWRHRLPSSDLPSRLIQVHFPYLFGKEALDKGELKLADRLFQAAARMGWEMDWLQANIGSIYARSGRLAEAERFYRRAVGLDPYFFEAQYGMGFLNLSKGDLAGAVSSYEKAVRLNPNSPDAYYMLGISEERKGENLEAKACFEKFLVLDPSNPQAVAVRRKLEKLSN